MELTGPDCGKPWESCQYQCLRGGTLLPRQEDDGCLTCLIEEMCGCASRSRASTGVPKFVM